MGRAETLLSRWTALRGRTAACSNLTIATGHAMLGLSLGPISGKLVAQVISVETPSLDLNLLDPDRYRRNGAGAP